MILSASRRCDIPAHFSNWFYHRIQEGYAYVRNPFSFHQVSRINLSPDVVDCIVFWSKNPHPMLPRLSVLNEYMYYFQFTLNAYGQEIEPNLPDLTARIRTFQELAGRLGKRRVLWRYDPVILTPVYTTAWHQDRFAYLAERLSDYTETCVFSFPDLYPSMARRAAPSGIRPLNGPEKNNVAQALSAIARSYGLGLYTCAEDIDLSPYQIGHARCIDPFLISRLLGCDLDWKKDSGQRPGCGCAAAIDLGVYHTCTHGCVYCYANSKNGPSPARLQAYEETAPLLCSRLTAADRILEPDIKSGKDPQLRLPFPI